MVSPRVRLREFIRYKVFPRVIAAWERAEAIVAAHPAAWDGQPQARDGVLVITHGMGGGVDKQALAEAAAFAARGLPVHVLSFRVLRRTFVLRSLSGTGGGETFCMPLQAAALWARLDALGLGRVRLHHLRFWPFYIVRDLAGYFQSRQLKYSLHLHDFYYPCPRIHLLRGNYRLCSVPVDSTICNDCVARDGSFVSGGFDVGQWRRQHEVLLRQATEVLAPSEDCAAYNRKIFPWLKVTVQPHENIDYPRLKSTVVGPNVSIAIVGNLIRNKGADIVLAAARHCRQTQQPITFSVIGDSVYAQELRAEGVTVTGAYAAADLPGLLDAAQVHFVWLASPWPETYCFVLSEIWRAGYVAFMFDLGAPAERARLRGGDDVILPTALMDDMPGLCRAFLHSGKRDA